MDTNTFYNLSQRSQLSERGYYPEKIEFFESELGDLKKHANLPLSILDVACNDGQLTQRYAKFGSAIGIDINANAIRKAQKNTSSAYICTDLPGIKKKYKNYFDVVVAGDIIEHIFDTDQFLDDIKFVLKVGGILLLTTPNVSSFGRRIMLLVGINPFLEYSMKLPNEEVNCGHIRYYTPGNIRSQMEFHGLTVEKLYGNKINLTQTISIPYSIAKYIPSLSISTMIRARKQI